MASNYRTLMINNLTISETSTGLFDASGNALATADIIGTNNYAYSKAFELNNLSEDYILTAICAGCTLEVKLEMSPDGVNWCPCNLSGGNACEVECTATTGDCTTQVVDVNLLPFVRVKIGNAGSDGGTCTIALHYDFIQEQVTQVVTSSGIDETSAAQGVAIPIATVGINQKVTE